MVLLLVYWRRPSVCEVDGAAVGAGADGLEIGGGKQALAAVDGADVVPAGVAIDELPGPRGSAAPRQPAVVCSTALSFDPRLVAVKL